MPAGRKGNTAKRIVQHACLLALSYGMLELFSLGAYYYTFGEPFSFEAVADKRQAVLPSASESDARSHSYKIQEPIGIHPYLGYTLYTPSPVIKDSLGHFNYMDYTFLGEADPLVASRDPKNAIVIITGGSVAQGQYTNVKARRELHQYLDALPAFKGRKVIISSFAIWGYSQPQHAMAVAYHLLQGGRIDMVINIDGKNESLYPVQQLQRGVYPAYPYHFMRFFLKGHNETSYEALGYMMLWKIRRQDAATIASYLPFSVTASTAWTIADQYMQNKINGLHVIYSGQVEAIDWGKGQYPEGVFRGVNASNIYDFANTLWMQGSMQIHHLSQAYGFKYFHFLQPNQYAPGGEARVTASHMYLPDGEEAQYVREMYPRFESRMPAMRAAGVQVYSMTRLFNNHDEQFYIDPCCHLNPRGRIMLNSEIGRIITKALATEQ